MELYPCWRPVLALERTSRLVEPTPYHHVPEPLMKFQMPWNHRPVPEDIFPTPSATFQAPLSKSFFPGAVGAGACGVWVATLVEVETVGHTVAEVGLQLLQEALGLTGGKDARGDCVAKL